MTRTDTPALPVPVTPSRADRRPNAAEALLAAQAGARRGLKAGTSALIHARSAYGETQWSGEHDRRPETGLLVRARL